jgi:MFS family permease
MKKSSFFPIFGITLLAFTAYLDATIVNTALPFIKSSLNLNILSLQWVANIFTLLLSMTMIVFGKIGDLLGKKKTFSVSRAAVDPKQSLYCVYVISYWSPPRQFQVMIPPRI